MLLSALAENVLVILAYDNERASTIRGLIDPSLFGGLHRQIAVRIYDYIDRYKKPPGDHLPDLFPDKLESQNQREVELFVELFDAIKEAKEHVNPEYVMATLGVYIKRQSLRSISADLVKHLQRDTEADIEKAELLLAGANRQALTVFDAGTRLSDPKRALKFLDESVKAFPTGIKELDVRGFGPTRKELWMAIAEAKAGKTWLLTHLAKMAVLNRMRVVHVSLEMSEERCTQRYFQALFSIAKRDDLLNTTRITLDDLGRISGFDVQQRKPKLTLSDPNIRVKLQRKIEKFGTRFLDNIFIKEFPTGSLTMGQLTAYLDHLETSERFTPDLLIVDYPDLMKLDVENFRHSISQLVKELRGLGVSRNMAVAAVSQANREGAKAKQLDATHVAEDWSKVANADTIITYKQTEAERRLGLARLFVAGGRNDQDRITIVISQQYATGGFVIDSALMRGTYWESIGQTPDEPIP